MAGTRMLNGLLLFGICWTLFGCPSKEEDTFRSMVRYHVSPQKDTIKLGETIWVEANFSSAFTDLSGSRTRHYSESIWCRFPISEISDQAADGIYFNTSKQNYEVTVYEGILLKDEGILVEANFEKDTYKVKFGIRFKKSGLYILTDDLGWAERSVVTFFQTFDVTSINAHLVPEDLATVKKMLADYEDEDIAVVRNRVFCFYVK